MSESSITEPVNYVRFFQQVAEKTTGQSKELEIDKVCLTVLEEATGKDSKADRLALLGQMFEDVMRKGTKDQKESAQKVAKALHRTFLWKDVSPKVQNQIEKAMSQETIVKKFFKIVRSAITWLTLPAKQVKQERCLCDAAMEGFIQVRGDLSNEENTKVFRSIIENAVVEYNKNKKDNEKIEPLTYLRFIGRVEAAWAFEKLQSEVGKENLEKTFEEIKEKAKPDATPQSRPNEQEMQDL